MKKFNEKLENYKFNTDSYIKLSPMKSRPRSRTKPLSRKEAEKKFLEMIKITNKEFVEWEKQNIHSGSYDEMAPLIKVRMLRKMFRLPLKSKKISLKEFSKSNKEVCIDLIQNMSKIVCERMF